MTQLMSVFVFIFFTGQAVFAITNDGTYQCESRNGTIFSVKKNFVTMIDDTDSYDLPTIDFSRLSSEESGRYRNRAQAYAVENNIIDYKDIWLDLGDGYEGLLLIDLNDLKKSFFFGPGEIWTRLECELK